MVVKARCLPEAVRLILTEAVVTSCHFFVTRLGERDGPRQSRGLSTVSDLAIQTSRLTLVPQTLADVRAMIEGMTATDRAEVSPVWLAKLEDPASAAWTLGFSMVRRDEGSAVGTCGFKGPPEEGVVELAYGVSPEFQGQGYATEAARALVTYACDSGEVRVVRAHTRPEPNASTRVLEKCEFRFLGEVIDPEDGLVWRWEKTIDAV
jgi:RimJ/RimL family protein N-acetyltransferase